MSKQLKAILELITNILIIILAIIGIKTIVKMSNTLPYINEEKCYVITQNDKETKVCKVEEEG